MDAKAAVGERGLAGLANYELSRIANGIVQQHSSIDSRCSCASKSTTPGRCAIKPPSSTIDWPVTFEELPEKSQTTVSATSSGVPTRRSQGHQELHASQRHPEGIAFGWRLS